VSKPYLNTDYNPTAKPTSTDGRKWIKWETYLQNSTQ